MSESPRWYELPAGVLSECRWLTSSGVSGRSGSASGPRSCGEPSGWPSWRGPCPSGPWPSGECGGPEWPPGPRPPGPVLPGPVPPGRLPGPWVPGVPVCGWAPGPKSLPRATGCG
ncbi:hypothetical protein DMC64_12230 [Amycolatopsis sp. WAC 04197]|nr:hypothetical protein DMC64_12230 [Amycolatopsis sp. WAC 04197]